ncbi:hemagglutinin repeat-containing protein [Paraburkholderia sp. MMS20-SJTR3]|uniref:Hemagglutinin repeat-containing protein n=1 Tax=Paraburkholderia sejongensis TaxID=2886946 RepID=A0ABS8K3E1_9BURK|nr:hemagglutinin repeat-containing protein [Paraburkholderia sp. MMS20-SJTR3]MCC8396671.1 hemagglutinin repeat-containing protein [Paraburkholderia sp. MMS20-SJTR3]
MNKNMFRLVFSRCRGMLVAVTETAVGHGNADRGETRPAASRPLTLFAMRHAAFAALVLCGLAPVFADAQIVSSGTHAPNVIQTQNGLPQVNINKPSNAGVSVNTYSQFDVQKNGAILNNSPVVTNTQLAGQINGNANLSPGQSARIILNQVNSNSPSQLRGFLEVAGSKAEVVVANGSGIVVDGGGFINTTRGILTTGTPMLDASGNLTGFNVTGGTISVQGAGFNASNIDQVDLIARAVQANAAIYANTLDVVTGANQVDHDTLAATSIAGNGVAPGVSIDVSQLGGMYANRIVLVGTENGVGVSNAGVIAAQAGDLTLTTEGRLVLTGRTTASGDLNASAAGGVDNSGTTYAQQSVSVTTPGALTNSGTLAAQQNLNATTGSVASTGTLGAGINGDGSVAQSGDMTLSASGMLSATGTNVAGGNATLQGATVSVAGSSTAANGDLVLMAGGGDLNASGAKIEAGNALTAYAAGTLDTSAATLDATRLSTQAANLTNRNGTITQTGTGPTTVNVSGTLDNTGGTLQTNSANLALGPAALLNDNGTITNSGTGTLSVDSDTLSNNGGTLATNGALDIRADAVSNRDGMLAGQSTATLVVGSLDNSAGGYVGAQDVSISDSGALNNAGGTVQADGLLNVSAQTVGNDAGTIANGGTGTTVVNASGALSNTGNGFIGGNGDVSVSGAGIANTGGTVTAGGAASVTSGGALDNRAGFIQGNNAADVSAQGALDNSGGQIEANAATASLAVSGASVDNANGRIANIGTGATQISAATVTNANTGGVAGAGMIGGNGDVTVNARALSNTDGAQIVSGHDLTLNATQSVDNTGGSLSGASDLTLNGAQAAVSNANGSIHGNGVVSLDTASLDNTSGRIGNDAGSGGSVAITSGTLTNQDGAIGSDEDLSLTTNQLTGDGRIVAGRDGAVTIDGDYTQSAANRIQANHDLSFTTTGDFTNQGTLAAVNALTVNAANVDNQAGADLNSSSTTVNAVNAITNEGRIEGDTVTTNSATLTNTAAIIGNTVTLNGSQSIVNTGPAAIIAAASELNLYSPGDISNTAGANIFSLGDIHLAADATRDANGLLAHRSNSLTNDQSTIEAQGSVEVATQTLTNSRPAPTVETVTTDVESVHQTKRDKYMACTPTNGDGNADCGDALWSGPYKTPLTATYAASDVVSETSGPNATDRALVVNANGVQQTIWFNTSTTNPDGSVTVTYWDGYDPNINYDPATEYPVRSDGHNGYQRVEIARDTTTTTQQDQIVGPQAQQAQLLAGRNLVLANVGTLNNSYSAIAAGGSIQIGTSSQDGEVSGGAGNYGGTTVNNTGQTLYQYQRQDIVSTYAWNENITQDVGAVVQPSIVLAPVAIGGTGGTIIANNAVQISATDVSNTNVAAANSSTGATGGTLGANQLMTGTQVSAPQSVANSTGQLDIRLPTSGLYTYQSAPDASYLVVTDPRLTSYTSFISSDYMLQQLGLNPQRVEKRLGDGMYEEQLVGEQITQLTGRVYLEGYTDNLEQYQALMTSGVNVAQQFGLVPGIALTAAQMDALTSDIVWLVSQSVTLPDGSRQQVLAPVVYLAQTHANDLQPTGALIAADDVEIRATGSATNSGVIKGGTQTVVSATDILNRGGTIGSSGTDGTTVVSATNDVVNASGMISGNRVAVLAGNDIVSTTLVDVNGISSAAGDSKVSQTLLGAQGTIASTGDMVIAAGNDLTVRGANISAGGAAQISAGHDITVDAVQSTTSQSLAQNHQHHWEESTVINQTSAISAGGDLAIQSGNDATFKGATVTAGGDMAVVASGNLTATTVTDTAKYDNVATDGRSRKEVDHTYDERSVGSSFTAGGNATLGAVSSDVGKGNVTLTGSSLTAGMTNGVDNGTGTASIAATGNVTINEAREEHDSYQAVQSKRGSFVSGSTIDTTQDTHANVAVGSLVSGDTVDIQAGKDLTIKGSTVVGTNDVNLAAAGNVTITTSQDTQNTATSYEKHQSGLMSSGGVGFSIGSASLKETTQTSQVTNNASTVGSLDGNLTINAGNDLQVTGSDLVAGKDVTGTAANVTIDAATNSYQTAESQETHKSGVTLALSGSVGDAINSAIQQTQATRDSAGNGNDRAAALHAIAAVGNAGIAVAGVTGGALAGQNPSIAVQLSVGSSQSKSNSSEVQATQQGSSVTAGGAASFIATGDSTAGSGNMTIAGSNVNANDVLLAAKNQVNIVNTTDTDSKRSSNSSSSASVGVSYGTNGFGVSASMSNAHGDANSDAAIQNNSHITGTNSVAMVSGGDTNIIGSDVAGGTVTANVGGNLNIASVQDTTASAAHQSSAGGGFSISQGGGSASFSAQNGHADSDYAQVKEQAGIYAGDGGFDINVNGNTDLKGAVIASDADASENSLTTGTLTFSDIENRSHYSATSNGVSVGGGVGSTGKATGPGSVGGSGGVVPMMSQNENGDESATTRSAIGAGAINITNGAVQTQDLASLSRDTTNTNGTVSSTPDVNNLLSQQADTMAAAQAAGQVVAQGIGAYADVKRNVALASSDQATADAWDEGGSNRVALHVVGGALVAGLGGGSIGSAAAGAAGAGFASAFAGKLNGLADQIGDATGSMTLGNVVSNVLAGAGGALVGGSAGAFTASNADLYNRSTGNADGKGGTGSDFLDRLGDAIRSTADDPLGALNHALNSIVPAPGQQPDADPNPLVQANDNGKPPATGGAVVTPPAVVCTPNAGCVMTPAVTTPGTPGYAPGNATLNSGDNGAGGNAQSDVNLASPDRTDHILTGDATGGGHQWPGGPGKSVFPQDWSSSKIMNAVSDIATDPSIPETVQANGRIVKNGSVDGIDIRVVIEPASKGGGIVTAFPTNVPRNPK